MEIKKIEVERKFSKCPHCGAEKLALYGGSLNYYIRNYLEGPSPYTKQQLASALEHLSKAETVKETVQELIADIDAKRQKVAGLDALLEERPSQELAVNKYREISVFPCSCGEVLPYKAWGQVKKQIDAYICQKCGLVMEDDPSNIAGVGELICPKCCIYVGNEDLEILNRLGKDHERELFDHRKYNKKEHLLTGEPYNCDGEALAELEQLSKELNYKFHIGGYSKHDSCCLTIYVKKLKNAGVS